jgi:hypothetical protein
LAASAPQFGSGGPHRRAAITDHGYGNDIARWAYGANPPRRSLTAPWQIPARLPWHRLLLGWGKGRCARAPADHNGDRNVEHYRFPAEALTPFTRG